MSRCDESTMAWQRTFPRPAATTCPPLRTILQLSGLPNEAIFIYFLLGGMPKPAGTLRYSSPAAGLLR